MTHDLHNEFVEYGRSLSSAPLVIQLDRHQHQSWVERVEGRLRGIWEALTCNRSSDVVQLRHLQRPPRPPMQQQPHPMDQHLRHQPRPRLETQPMQRPPHPGEAGGSSWQHHQHTPTSGQHPMSGSGWETDQEGMHYINDFRSTHDQWVERYVNDPPAYPSQQTQDPIFQTPPPDPTQDTQDHGQPTGNLTIPRQNRRPHRYMYSTPVQPPPRDARERRNG